MKPTTDKRLLALLLFLLPVAGQSQLPVHPYRIIGETHYDLRPIYNWNLHRERGPRPMHEWIGIGENKYPSLDTRYYVRAVARDGLILESIPMPHPSGSERTLFLKNYPGWTNCIDDQRIEFLALPTGNHRYNDAGGALRTILQLDYGIPYDPAELQRRTTNAPSEHTQ